MNYFVVIGFVFMAFMLGLAYSMIGQPASTTPVTWEIVPTMGIFMGALFSLGYFGGRRDAKI